MFSFQIQIVENKQYSLVQGINQNWNSNSFAKFKNVASVKHCFYTRLYNTTMKISN